MTILNNASKHEKRIVYLLFCVQVAAIGAMELSGPFWPIHLQNIANSSWQASIASVGVYVLPMFGIMLTSTFWGSLGDRIGRKWMLVRALIGLALTQLALAYADSVWFIMVLRFIQGACAGYVATAQAYGVQVVPTERRTRFFAFLQIATNVGSLVGATLGGYILDASSFFWINFTGAMVCCVCILLVIALLPSLPPDCKPVNKASNNAHPDEDSASQIRYVIIALLGVIAMLLFSRMLVTTNFALYVQSQFLVGNWLSGLTYGLWAMGFIVSASLWARYFEQHSWQQMSKRLLWVIAGCLLINLVLAATPWFAVFMIAYGLWGVLLAATQPVLLAQISKLAKAESQGRLLGAAQGIQQAANIAGIATGALLTNLYGLQVTYWAVAAGYLLTLVLLLGIVFGLAKVKALMG